MELGINSKNIKCSSTLNLSLQIVMATLTFFETLDSIKFRTKKLCTFFVSTFQCYCYNILRKCVFKELDPSAFVFSAEQAVICPYQAVVRASVEFVGSVAAQRFSLHLPSPISMIRLTVQLHSAVYHAEFLQNRTGKFGFEVRGFSFPFHEYQDIIVSILQVKQLTSPPPPFV